MRLFFEAARDPDAAFAVEASATVIVEGLPEPVPPVTAVTTGRVVGANWEQQINVREGDTVILEAAVMALGNRVWLREAGADAWQERQALPAQLPKANPFARISTTTEVAYLGEEAGDHGVTHHLQVTKWLGGTDYDDLLVGIAIVDQDSTLDIWVTDGGIPLRATLTIGVVASDGEQQASIRTDATYTFSDWGNETPIQPPT